jgi:hypothetical protein
MDTIKISFIDDELHKRTFCKVQEASVMPTCPASFLQKDSRQAGMTIYNTVYNCMAEQWTTKL